MEHGRLKGWRKMAVRVIARKSGTGRVQGRPLPSHRAVVYIRLAPTRRLERCDLHRLDGPPRSTAAVGASIAARARQGHNEEWWTDAHEDPEATNGAEDNPTDEDRVYSRAELVERGAS
jgi:hypothetical protein